MILLNTNAKSIFDPPNLQSSESKTTSSLSSISVNSLNNNNTEIFVPPVGIKIAYCVTGQLSRLELLSKITNIFIANAKFGNTPHVYLYLDNEIHNVKQTYWHYNYSMSPYGHMTRQELLAFIDKIQSKLGFPNKKSIVRTRVKLASPSRDLFHVVNDKVPVKAKLFSGHDGPKSNYESADIRFQNNMRWMNGLRDCIKWVQNMEVVQRYHYDIVVRLRDDSYVSSNISLFINYSLLSI